MGRRLLGLWASRASASASTAFATLTTANTATTSSRGAWSHFHRNRLVLVHHRIQRLLGTVSIYGWSRHEGSQGVAPPDERVPRPSHGPQQEVHRLRARTAGYSRQWLCGSANRCRLLLPGKWILGYGADGGGRPDHRATQHGYRRYYGKHWHHGHHHRHVYDGDL